MTDGFRLPLNSNCTSQKPRNPRQSTENSWRKSLLPPSLTGFPPVLTQAGSRFQIVRTKSTITL